MTDSPSTPAFLDSNVVLYLLSADSKKADTAEALLQTRPVVSVQVLNEVTSVCRRKLEMPWGEIESLLGAVKAYCHVTPLTLESHAMAMQVVQRHRLSFYDAHIVASAVLAGANLLFSEDMHNGLQIQGLRIQNPFTGH